MEVIYSGSTKKIKLSDGRILVMTEGRKIIMPEKDWYSTFSKSGNFKLVAKESEDIEEVMKKTEEKKKRKKRRT